VPTRQSTAVSASYSLDVPTVSICHTLTFPATGPRAPKCRYAQGCSLLERIRRPDPSYVLEASAICCLSARLEKSHHRPRAVAGSRCLGYWSALRYVPNGSQEHVKAQTSSSHSEYERCASPIGRLRRPENSLDTCSTGPQNAV